MTEQQVPEQADLRARAIKRLKKRRDFVGHLLIYTLVNGVLVAIWAMTSPGEFFWPVFFIGIWGIGLVMNAWDVFVADDIDETRIQEEMERLEKRR